MTLADEAPLVIAGDPTEEELEALVRALRLVAAARRAGRARHGRPAPGYASPRSWTSRSI
ncbi:hypothetical protein HII36_25530 [Nonomuraea sp. NN258]|uniref:acyl-CoA carboxylase epsilon subunit n=1 Tax=Nonomuraea antri TaxID=2730852 RepID=UPI0015696421|nr:acyl-CoA carboxylase epsilon subunit [Nonomuraea antri]NRQ35161.1 hypothetical protein [Nonomuraea antri]